MKYLIILALAGLGAYFLLGRETATPGHQGVTLPDLMKAEKSSIVAPAGKKTQEVTGKYTFVYFSAGWCPPCHAFTPRLVKLWNEAGAQRDFDVIFVSSDRSKEDMQDYITEMEMPWSYVAYGTPAAQRFEDNFGENGIPNLILFDQSGKIIAQSYKDGKYVGPYVVGKAYEALH